jgi:hypothetical protein
MSRIAAAIAVAAATAVATATAVAAATAVATATPAAVAAVPRPCADEDAAIKPIRPVVAIRGARIRIVAVVAPIAGRGVVHHGCGNHCGTNAHSHPDLGRGHAGQRQSQQHCK